MKQALGEGSGTAQQSTQTEGRRLCDVRDAHEHAAPGQDRKAQPFHQIGKGGVIGHHMRGQPAAGLFQSHPHLSIGAGGGGPRVGAGAGGVAQDHFLVREAAAGQCYQPFHTQQPLHEPGVGQNGIVACPFAVSQRGQPVVHPAQQLRAFGKAQTAQALAAGPATLGNLLCERAVAAPVWGLVCCTF